MKKITVALIAFGAFVIGSSLSRKRHHSQSKSS
ncbi:BH3695 [Halalkalibacterium halodurans C-125]|uniref:BH3695 protein n=1 Tax=Halalkalibacterium halodurans (strain ATCC BAA-125 / DSM 18197 / FERM 7344 / JCM 9153 / C-125) TaxID=272558 RepID=Q9K6N3_HALH5|nr:BH3695 [Halalkalibacterium halodurans C-125]